MRTFDGYTRFNADHTRSITVGYDDHAEYDDTITNDIAYMGLEVLTGNEQLAHVMGVEPVTDKRSCCIEERRPRLLSEVR